MGGGDDNTTPKAKLNFDLLGGQGSLVQKQLADANPFPVLNVENGNSDFF
jgi:hypothetical protein